jgi:excinuclease ABC subunit A
MHVRVQLSRYRSYSVCGDCGGGRFQPAALNYRVNGKTLPELAALPASELAGVMKGVLDGIGEDAAAKTLAQEVFARVNYLLEVGVGYLSLDRQTRTLSGGEVERVNLTTCLGACLVNTLFVLDEPTVGLHPRDVERMVRVMKELRDRGNTLLVVEHDEAVMRAADNMIELGPGRGDAGGDLVFNGPLSELKGTLTADYLKGRKFIPVPKARRKPKGWLQLKGVTHHNLRDLDVSFPLGVFACVTGVSGSGKSTLVHDVLYQNLIRHMGLGGGDEEREVGACRAIEGADQIQSVSMVDQSPLSRTPRSNPALYLGVFDAIRDLFAKLPESIRQGCSASSFSFNSGTGRCERCKGAGCE